MKHNNSWTKLGQNVAEKILNKRIHLISNTDLSIVEGWNNELYLYQSTELESKCEREVITEERK